MNVGIQSKHAHLLWRMIFMEEHREISLSDCSLKGKKERQPLLDAGLVEEVKRKPNKGRARTYLVLTERAWPWAADNLDLELNRAPKATDVLQRVLAHLQRHLANRNLSLVEFIDPGDPAASAPSVDVETRIRDTYFDFSYGRTNVPMPIATLRDALPGIAAAQLEEGLKNMLSKPGVVLYPEDNPRTRTPEMEAGALNLNGAIKHYLKLER